MKLTKERCKFTQSSYRYLFVYMLHVGYLMASSDVQSYEEDLKHLKHQSSLRQRGRAVRAPDLKSVGRGFKSRSDR